MDINGYPDDKELKKIKKWPFRVDEKIVFQSLMDFVKERWHFADWGWRETSKRWYVSTGGWSGNENLIGALNDNFFFMSFCALSWHTGGHYVFEKKRQK